MTTQTTNIVSVMSQTTLKARFFEVSRLVYDFHASITEAEVLFEEVLKEVDCPESEKERLRFAMAQEIASLSMCHFFTWQENLQYKLETCTVRILKEGEVFTANPFA